jgi:hypothetical protein
MRGLALRLAPTELSLAPLSSRVRMCRGENEPLPGIFEL